MARVVGSGTGAVMTEGVKSTVTGGDRQIAETEIQGVAASGEAGAAHGTRTERGGAKQHRHVIRPRDG